MRNTYYQLQYRVQIMEDIQSCTSKDRYKEFDDAFAAYRELKENTERSTLMKLLSAAIVKVQEDTVWTY